MESLNFTKELNTTDKEEAIRDLARLYERMVMRKHTIPPIPKVGTIVEYNDERGVTLKKLGRKKNPETGKMEYVLHPLNPDFGDIEPMDGGKISGIYVETLDRWEKA